MLLDCCLYMNKNLLGRLCQQGVLLTACFGLFAVNNVSAGTATARLGSQPEQVSVPVYGDSSRWGIYFRQLQDTMATFWYEEITYYSSGYPHSQGSVTASYRFQP
jgi:hypothetical protein